MTRLVRAKNGSQVLAVATLFLLCNCASDRSDRPLFKLLPAEQTGVTFANNITVSDSLNVATDVYLYNGAGVAVGDINNDGLSDIFFAGNMVSSRLYLNRGNMRFEDITARAAVSTSRWATGVAMVDINDDGYLDIYVSVSGPGWSKGIDRSNLLFVNNGNLNFSEAAERYGIADTNFTTHSLFLDYDRDGCLDLFLLNNSPKDFSRGVSNHPTGMRGTTPGSHNELYRNECRSGKPGMFTRVSEQAGIVRDAGFGLGAVAADLNRDGWPDIYVSNDVEPNDVVYVNNGDGTFTNKAATWLKHASYAGMGVDVADFNNDGWPDILQVDMLPAELSRRKRMSGIMTHSSQLLARQQGFRNDYSANTLQLSNGVTKSGDLLFSDIARLAGVAATDWSWSALFADFDNDGFKDIFISNGYPKAVNDFDYLTAHAALRRSGSRSAGLRILDTLHAYRFTNHVFRNDGELTFSDKTRAWDLDEPGISYGAAYADLDNNGTLDLVISTIDGPALIYENLGVRGGDNAHHWLQVRLRGQRQIGSLIVVTAAGRKQHIYHSPYRGYMSSVEDRAHFGLGRVLRVDTLEVVWPDGSTQVLANLDVDRVLTLSQSGAASASQHSGQNSDPPARNDTTEHEQLAFRELDPAWGLTHVHQAGTQVDYGVQALLPYMISRQGPSIAVGDVNGDNRDDVFITGGPRAPGRLFIQLSTGSFAPSTSEQAWDADKAYEDWGALFFDANGDSLSDLYVASGSYQVAPGSPLLQDRLYINQGGGRFTRDTSALPSMLTSTAAVRAGDFTGDGRPDLFVGGRLTPRDYPNPARSYLLRSEGGRFVDVTEEIAPELVNPGGMITDAIWIDFDGDKRLDLVTVGEWMPIQFFRNDGRRFTNVTRSAGLPPTRGWWFSLAAGDFDKDGRPDMIAGNLGLNHYVTSDQSGLGVYAADFDGNRTTDVILTQKVEGTEFTLAGLVPLGRELYQLGLRYPTFASFARAPLREVFSSAQLERALHAETDTFASVFLRNEGNGAFSMSPLPNLAQIAPIKGIVPHDVDGDGHLDLIVSGNLYDAEPNTTRADAGNGLWLRGDGKGNFEPVSPRESGFLTPGNVSGLALIDTPNGKVVLVANTGDSLQVFAVKRNRLP